MSSINAAIEAAQAAAAAIPAEATGSTAVATTAPSKGAPLSVNDMLAGSMSVDGWLKVNYYGLFIGADDTPITSINARIDLSMVAYCYSLRFGQPPTYLKSYDRMVSTRGKPWADEIAMAQKVDPKAGEFRSADVVIEVLEDIKNKKGDILIEAGQNLGYSLSVTGWKYFAAFLNDVKKLGLDIEMASVDVKIGYEARKKDSNQWGNLVFETVKPAAAKAA